MELQEVKKQANNIMMGTTNDFIMISHEFVVDDIWEVICHSKSTGKYYTFKSEGSEFDDFKEKD